MQISDGCVAMTEQKAEEVELSSLISGNNGNRADEDGNDDVERFKAVTPPFGSGYTGRDVVLFLLSFISAILAVLVMVVSAYLFGTSAKTITIPHEADIDDNDSWYNMRWQPKSTTDGSNNCLPRFQLANATIHCGAGDLVPLTTSSNGEEYCGGVRMEPNYCMLPMEGHWAVVPSSPLHKNVSLIPPLPRRFGINTNSTNSTSLPYCKTIEEFINGTYDGSGFDQEWVPNSCSSVPLSPFAWSQNAECQMTITMMGDSHIRNLFTATVNGLRGVESFTEAHADTAGKGRGIAQTYEWRLLKDGSATDRIAVHTDTKTNNPTIFEDCPCGDEVQRCLRIAFIWAPMFNEQLSQIDFVTKWKSNIVIVEPGNAYEHSVALSPAWTAKLDELMRDDENLQLGILHFSWGSQPKERGDALTAWTTNGTYADRKSYLKQSAMTATVGGMQGRKTFHFSCGLGKVNVENDIITAAEPCTDLTDTAEIRALITVHFDAFSKSAERLP